MVSGAGEGSISRALLDRLVGIARQAGAAIMTHYAADAAASVRRKSDQSPLTEADLASHRVIAAGLEGLLPDVPVVSEEGWIPSPREQEALGRFWLVDPLDGTKEFVSRNGEFTVNIALIEGDRPVAGVVYAPALDQLYFAAGSLGAWRRTRGDDAPVRLSSSPRPPGEPLVVVESRSHPSAELEAWLAAVPVARRVAVGSSLKFCWVADGTADVYPRLGPTMEWDVAAGDCVFRCSGLGTGRWSPLEYNKPGFRNSAFVLGLSEEATRVS